MTRITDLLVDCLGWLMVHRYEVAFPLLVVGWVALVFLVT